MQYEHMNDWTWNDLRQPLMELLLSFYNGDFESQPATLLDNLTGVFEILNFWRLHGKSDGEEFTAKNMLNFFVDQVIQVVSEILDKLLHKAAFKFQIVSFTRNTHVDHPEGQDEAPEAFE